VQAPQLNVTEELTAHLFPQRWKWTCAVTQLASQPLTLTIF